MISPAVLGLLIWFNEFMSSFGVQDTTEGSFVYDMKLLLGSIDPWVKHALPLMPAPRFGLRN